MWLYFQSVPNQFKGGNKFTVAGNIWGLIFQVKIGLVSILKEGTNEHKYNTEILIQPDI